jgi:diacylglycerol kinase family enzyme
MVFEEFSSLLSELCSRSSLAEGRTLVWTIIANPSAGGFTIRSRWKKHYAMLLECVKKAKGYSRLTEARPSLAAQREGGLTGSSGLILTKGAGHALEITRALLEEAATNKETKQPFYLVISSGGDGTSLEVMTGLYNAPPELRRNFAVLRLPMGTGNDGADAQELDKALDLIIGPSELAMQRALTLTTASGKGPFLAFNILSVGLDAFVTHMTNRMKGKMPGDSYKLWVDIAALFYDKIYKVGYMEVRSRGFDGKEAKSFREELLLLAVGESGRRSYGAQKWILPDERNVCAMKQMPLFRKLALKGLINSGTHASEGEALLWSAKSIDFLPQYPILAQMDGETMLLKEDDFPARIELSDPVIQILRPRG